MAKASIEKPKILCVDDEPGVLESLDRLLKTDFQVLTATDAFSALQLLEEHRDVAVIISDYRMPKKNGTEFLNEAKQIVPLAARTILSGQMDIAQLSEAINRGLIHRFFLKPWENEYLKLQIFEALQTHVNLSEKDHFRHLANTDPVTGLMNHRFFQDQIRKDLEEKARLALLMVDVDHFKSFNDRYGHPEGDRLLWEISQYLLSKTGDAGTVCRYGGEEFSILLPHFSGPKAEHFAEKLREDLGSAPLPGPGRKSYVTVSIGIALFPEHAKTAEQLIEIADQALYTSKDQGRNRSTLAKKTG